MPFPIHKVFTPSERRVDDPMGFATRMRMALYQTELWACFVLSPIDLSNLDGIALEIGQRFNIYMWAADGNADPYIKIYTGRRGWDSDVDEIDFQVTPSVSFGKPYTVEVLHWSKDIDGLRAYRYTIDTDDCDKLLGAAFRSPVLIEET